MCSQTYTFCLHGHANQQVNHNQPEQINACGKFLRSIPK